jgi:hypothetical protein
MRRPSPVQAARVALEAIEDGVVRLAGGLHRAVLEVGAVNFALRGERDQEAIVAGYAAFLNALTFPLQILVRVLPVDVEEYLGGLERRAREERCERLAELARDHVAFVRRLARSRTLLQRAFYVVVPADGATAGRGPWPFGRRRDREVDAAAVHRQLTVRCEEVERQLGRCGLPARRLGDAALAQLEHACWSPELARVQRVRRALADYTAPVVTAGPAERRTPCS